MKHVLKYATLLLAIASFHTVLLYALSMLWFISQLGAIQGGDVPISSEEAARRATFKPYEDAFEHALGATVAVLAWPGSTITKHPPPLSAPWLLTSLSWAAFALLVFLVTSRIMRYHRREPNVA